MITIDRSESQQDDTLKAVENAIKSTDKKELFKAADLLTVDNWQSVQAQYDKDRQNPDSHLPPVTLGEGSINVQGYGTFDNHPHELKKVDRSESQQDDTLKAVENAIESTDKGDLFKAADLLTADNWQSIQAQYDKDRQNPDSHLPPVTLGEGSINVQGYGTFDNHPHELKKDSSNK